MYERNAIVLERYFEKIFGFTKESNLKRNFDNYSQIIKAIKEYKNVVDEEEKIISKFDEIAEEIQEIQKSQAKLHEINTELENQRNRLFNELGENPNVLDTKLQKIEEKLQKNNEELIDLRSRYVKAIVLFIERQKERNKYARVRRTAETEYRNQINLSKKIFESIKKEDTRKIQEFLHLESGKTEQDVVEVLDKNGKSERVPFNSKVLEKATKARIEIAKIEAQLYLNIYERTKRILSEIEGETIRLGKAEKIIKDTEVKLAFLDAEKEYIVAFLDNERMTVINGQKTHDKLMEEACNNFDKDMTQIANLYELIIRETINKSTKKAYKELYNKDYLRKIEEKEKDFEQEVTSIKVNIGTVINSNYWRSEGIKNIYKVFEEQITEKFNKDLSEFKTEEPEIIVQDVQEENQVENNENLESEYDETSQNNNKTFIDDNYEDEDEDYDYLDDEKYINHEYDDEDEEDEYSNDEYDDDEDKEEKDEYDDYDDDDEEEKDEYSDDEYDDFDDEDEEDEEEKDEYSDDEYDDYDDEDEEDEDEYSDEEYDDDEDEYDDDCDSEYDDEDDEYNDGKYENKDYYYDDDNEETDNNDYNVKNYENNEIPQDAEELTEEKIDEIIRNSRKKKRRSNIKSSRHSRFKDDDNLKGLIGKLFKK